MEFISLLLFFLPLLSLLFLVCSALDAKSKKRIPFIQKLDSRVIWIAVFALGVVILAVLSVTGHFMGNNARIDISFSAQHALESHMDAVRRILKEGETKEKHLLRAQIVDELTKPPTVSFFSDPEFFQLALFQADGKWACLVRMPVDQTVIITQSGEVKLTDKPAR